ncbi:glycerol-3-phosphate dehydrogenase [Aquabacterium sp. J223]|uniref:glycerol-3-phosphate dehydrogenase n=1 Tax=Aquabacterium sp. J223 TaxID=2898431 RepID=UPI0021AD7071|nr:glycerol-3-phosphate dehydrogenase [Aquabacterium sp. J223]UUX96070.1 glycerol-3-phosphate dehydrogenase [Aquabacterium sp. J223]
MHAIKAAKRTPTTGPVRPTCAPPVPSTAFANTHREPARPTHCDVLVVGGGINGAGIARDLAGRGVSVVLVEQHDLAQHTSSASTKLIHGGLRYLEYYEFGLVRKALAERERLLRSAPHIMWPLRFVMPHDPSMRPVWMVRAGLFLYDHLARRELLPASRTVDLTRHPAGAPLHKRFTKGFVYSDGWVDDARLVVLNAVDAAAHGAAVLTRCRCSAAQRDASGWRVRLQSADGAEWPLQARALVNAAGPWAEQFLRRGVARHAETKALRLVKGSHIVVPRLFQHDHAYILQNPDKRIIFAIPYEGDFTLIGTTDVDHPGGADDEVRAGADEIAYLCEQASRYFERRLTPADVVWTYAGVRPLLDEEGSAASVTRDYVLALDGDAGAPLLSVWGGKITTFRKLAEEAGDRLAPLVGGGAAWTADALLPGGDLSAWIGPPRRPDMDFERFVTALGQARPALDPRLLRRWARAYGSRVQHLLDDADGLGREVAPGVHEAELRYLVRHEWARSADDMLWRRSKLGLHLTADQRQAVADWFDTALRPPAAPAAREASWN